MKFLERYAVDMLLIFTKLLVLAVFAGQAGHFVYQAF
jgi:hypothetical protein